MVLQKKENQSTEDYKHTIMPNEEKLDESQDRAEYWTIRNDHEATRRCEDCLDKEWEPGDEILFCDWCNAGVHIKCCMKWDA